MPSRDIPPPITVPSVAPGPKTASSPSSTDSQPYIHHRPLSTRLLTPLAAAAATAAFSLLIVFVVCFRKISRKRTAPSDSKPPYQFSYSSLRRATGSFSPSNRLGQGGFGTVFRGTLSSSSFSPDVKKSVAVKVMDSGSLQGEREYQNEIFFASKLDSPFVVPVIGLSSDRKRRRMLLVYELLVNGNLQDALLHRKCCELMEWKQRFSIAVDIAKGMDYLHSLEPPVIHGDIKPSNILLDQLFSARVADFGLARLKSEDQNQKLCEIVVTESDGTKLENQGGVTAEDCGSVVETESVTTTGFEEFNLGGVDLSPESIVRVPGLAMASPETLEASPETNRVSASPEKLEKPRVSEGNFYKGGLEGQELDLINEAKRKNAPGKDWWWSQDNVVADKGKVKDYVMDWIGKEIKKEKPSSNDWIAASSSFSKIEKPDKKKKKEKLEWWVALDEEKEQQNVKKLKSEKRKSVREWWREEYSEELARKNKKEKKKKQELGTHSDDNGVDDWWPGDEELYAEKKKKKRSRSRSSLGSVDWWLDGLSGELRRAHHTSHDSVSGEIPKSGGISSTPSMRGTICYIAPECGGGGGGGGELSEKSDVYSYGVLLLVLIAGRRPLDVTGSTSEFKRANLISWARHLARSGKLLSLVDEAIKSLSHEQALLSITVALLCLQKQPACRPSMREVVGMLTGEAEPPQLPTEFSPSPPPLRFPFKSRKKGK